MAVTASGLFFLTFEKFLIGAVAGALTLEAEDNKVAMITDLATPAFDTHDFWADLSANEVSGTGYTAGGNALTTTEITASPAGTLMFDAADASWTTSTITSAMAAVVYCDADNDELVVLSDFVTAASTTAGTFAILWASGGIFTIDLTPA